MQNGVLIVVLLAGLAALAQIRSDPRIDKAFRRKSYRALGFYAVFVACGIATLLILSSGATSERAALAAVAFFVAWVALGGLWLMRLAPRLREPPALLMKPWSVLDWTLVALSLGAALVAALG